MPSRRPALILAALSLLAAGVAAGPASSEEYHCRRDDLVRRIEVQFANDADRLPCQVVYWSDMARPDEKRVPWRAENQIEFCTRKAREMAERLRGSGWTCDIEIAAGRGCRRPGRSNPSDGVRDRTRRFRREGPAPESEIGEPQPDPATPCCKKRWPVTSAGSMS